MIIEVTLLDAVSPSFEVYHRLEQKALIMQIDPIPLIAHSHHCGISTLSVCGVGFSFFLYN